MSNIHTLKWNDSPSPQQQCQKCLSNGKPFIVATGNPNIKCGDMIIFPDFFVSYPVIREAKANEIIYRHAWAVNYFVLAEPPKKQITHKTVNQKRKRKNPSYVMEEKI